MRLDDLVAGAGGAWDNDLFESLSLGIDATLAENYARVSSVASELTDSEIDDFINENFHSIPDQVAARGAIDALRTDGISLPADFMTTFFSP